MAEMIPIDRGETPSLAELERMPEHRYRFLVIQKLDRSFDVLEGHERRITCLAGRCKSWHPWALRFLLGIVGTISGSGLGYLAFLAGQKIFGGP